MCEGVGVCKWGVPVGVFERGVFEQKKMLLIGLPTCHFWRLFVYI